MNFRSKTRRSQAGGVLVLALVITAAATAGFAAWSMLLGQRTQLVEQAIAGTQRRLSVESGRQMSRKYGYEVALGGSAGSAVNSSIQETASGVIHGGMSISAWSGYALDSTVFPTGHNPISPASTGLAYAKTLAVSLPYSIKDAYPNPVVTGSGNTDFIIEIKSRSPVLSGDLLVVHRPTLADASPPPLVAITGNLGVVNGRALYLMPLSNSLYTNVKASQITSPPAQPGTGATYPVNYDPANNAVNLPSNLPVPQMSAGLVAGSVADLGGRLNVVDATNNAPNSVKLKLQTGSYMILDSTQNYSERGVVFDNSTGVLTLDLDDELLPNVILENNVAKIVLTGQASAAEATVADPLGAVGLCYVENADTTTRSLTEIVCNGVFNKRRFLMALKKIPPAAQSPKAFGAAVTFKFSESNQGPLWRMLMVAENTPLAFDATGGAGLITMMGGIETDASITAPTTTGAGLKLTPETDPRRLNRLAPRLGWVETHLNLDNGSL